MNEQPAYKLIIVDDEGKSTVVPLTRDDYTIGRQEGNVIRLTERNVSRRHARLARENGRYFVENLKSYNGVFVNNERIKERTFVKSNDVVQIGDYRLIYRELSAPETDDAFVAREHAAPPPPPRIATAMPGEKPKLIIINGPRPGEVITLEDGETVIGRGENARLRIDDPSVSRQHTKIVLREDFCQIVDLESSNGIRINGIQKKEHYLSHGDTIEMGNILIRYIAAGAWDLLLEQIQQQSQVVPAASWRKPLYLAIPFVLLGVFVIMGIVYLLSMNAGRHKGTLANKELAAAKKASQPGVTPVDDLVRTAKEHYDGFDWKEAITYSAKALEVDPLNEKARKIKDRATRELENEPSWTKGLAAMKAKQWELAYRTFANLSLDSQYRTKPEFKEALDRFMEQLLEEARAAVAQKQWAVVEEKSLTIDSIIEASPLHKAEAQKYLALIPKEQKKEVAWVQEKGAAKTASPAAGGGEKKVKEVPGEGSLKTSSAQQTTGDNDPIAEAKKAIAANDQLKCIQILEKAKTSQLTLQLLASCYKAAGNKDRYLIILKRYVQKYPTAPQTEKYTKILQDAGQL